MYLDRIEAYDKKGPTLNSIVVTNPEALKVADTLVARGIPQSKTFISMNVPDPRIFNRASSVRRLPSARR